MLERFILLAVGLPLAVTGVSLAVIGVFAFVGIPLLVVGLGCVSAAVDPSR